MPSIHPSFTRSASQSKATISSVAMAVFLALSGGSSFSAQAQSKEVQDLLRSYSIPAGKLTDALTEFSAASGTTLAFDPLLLNGKSTLGLSGRFSVSEGFAHLLANSGFRAQHTNSGYILLASNTIALPSVTVSADQDKETATGPVEGYIARRSMTGMKTGTPIIETPQSVAVITADRIEAIGATRVTEALSYSAGVNPSPWGDQPQWDWFYIRGFDAYAPGVYLDGLQMRNSGNWGLWQVDNYSLERIEVMRGPSSVLYGVNGPGGMINLVSKMPTPFSQKELKLELGSDQHKLIATDISGPIDDKGEYSYRVTGLLKDAELSTAPLPDKRRYLAPSFTWQPSNDTNLTVYGQYFDLESGTTGMSLPLEGTLLANPNGDVELPLFIGEPGFNRYNQEQWLVGYQFEHQINDTWQIAQHARYATFDLDFGTIYNKWANINADSPEDPDNFRYLKRTGLSSQEDVTGVNVDTKLIAKLKTAGFEHTLLFGMDYQSTEIDVSARWGGTMTDLDIFNPVYGSEISEPEPNIAGITKVRQLGYYIQDQLKLNKHWLLNVAGRYDVAKTDTYLPDGTPNEQQTDYGFTSRLGLVYLADNGWAPYLSYSESFAPTSTINPQTLKQFSPEKGRQYEVGIRYQPSDNSARYSAAAFEILRKDYTQWIWGDNPRPVQMGAVKVQGVEFEAFVQPAENINVTATYSWIPKADVTRSAFPEEVGKQDLAVSEHQMSLWGDYRFDNGLTIGMGMRHTGSNQGTKEAAPRDVPSYTLYDAMIRYDIQQWELALNVRNVTDKLPLTTCDGAKCYYGSPSKVTMTATYSW